MKSKQVFLLDNMPLHRKSEIHRPELKPKQYCGIMYVYCFYLSECQSVHLQSKYLMNKVLYSGLFFFFKNICRMNSFQIGPYTQNYVFFQQSYTDVRAGEEKRLRAGRTRWQRSRQMWSTSLSMETSGIQYQTQKCMQDTS